MDDWLGCIIWIIYSKLPIYGSQEKNYGIHKGAGGLVCRSIGAVAA